MSATSDHSENEAGEIKSPTNYASEEESESDLTDSENEDDALDIKPPQAQLPPPPRGGGGSDREGGRSGKRGGGDRSFESSSKGRDRGAPLHQRLGSGGGSRSRGGADSRDPHNRSRDDDPRWSDRGRGGGGGGGDIRGGGGGKDYGGRLVTRDDYRRDPRDSMRDVRDARGGDSSSMRDNREVRDYEHRSSLDADRDNRRALEQKRIELEQEVIRKDREVTSWRQQMAERLQSAAASNRALSSVSGPPRGTEARGRSGKGSDSAPGSGGGGGSRGGSGDLRRELDRVREERSGSGGRDSRDRDGRGRMSDGGGSGGKRRYDDDVHGGSGGAGRSRLARDRSRSPVTGPSRPSRTVEYVDQEGEFPIQKGPMTPPVPPPAGPPAPRTPEGSPPPPLPRRRDEDDDDERLEHELSLSPGHSFIDDEEREQVLGAGAGGEGGGGGVVAVVSGGRKSGSGRGSPRGSPLHDFDRDNELEKLYQSRQQRSDDEKPAPPLPTISAAAKSFISSNVVVDTNSDSDSGSNRDAPVVKKKKSHSSSKLTSSSSKHHHLASSPSPPPPPPRASSSTQDFAATSSSSRKEEKRERHHHKKGKKEKKEKKKMRAISPPPPPPKSTGVSSLGSPVDSPTSEVEIEEQRKKKKKKSKNSSDATKRDDEPAADRPPSSKGDRVDEDRPPLPPDDEPPSPPPKMEVTALTGELGDAMDETPPPSPPPMALPPYYPAIQGCRNVEEFQCLNRIEEGTFGVVYRALDKKFEEIVALKRLKMEKEKEGFPITSLREINTLLKAQHSNIVTVREIVVGSNMDKIYIVMDYVEHDLKSLMESMKQPFLVGEVKTLMIQLCRAIKHMHDNWILHRDLKTSNLLLSHKGILKVGDFGLAREYGSPLKPYTPIVVTLWYRCPELLLGAKQYSTEIDMWSVGCIFGELLLMKPLFPGRSEIDQLNRIFKDLGTPSEKIWPKYGELPGVKKMSFAQHPYNVLRNRFGVDRLSQNGFDLMNRFLTYDPSKRYTAAEALKHPYIEESPLPIDPSMFPTWPAKSEIASSKAAAKAASVAGPTAESSPKPPSGGQQFKALSDANEEGGIGGAKDGGFAFGSAKSGAAKQGLGFTLKF